MTERKTIDVTAARRQKSLEFRLAKITTASDEEAAPYQSKASIYRGLWLDDSTARAAMLTGADVWTQHATTLNDWVLVVRTPFGRWEGAGPNLPNWAVSNTTIINLFESLAEAVYDEYGYITSPGWVLGRKSDGEGGFTYGWCATTDHADEHPD